jgi:hypothetical protein
MHAAEPLRVALIAPPWYPIPPPAYGGIEAMVYALAEDLVARGHQVTVLGAGEPDTRARFVPTFPVPPTERLGEALPEVLHAAHVTCCWASSTLMSSTTIRWRGRWPPSGVRCRRC